MLRVGAGGAPIATMRTGWDAFIALDLARLARKAASPGFGVTASAEIFRQFESLFSWVDGNSSFRDFGCTSGPIPVWFAIGNIPGRHLILCGTGSRGLHEDVE